MAQEVIVGLTAERAVMVKPLSRRVWPGARAPPEVMLSLRTGRAIEPFIDDTVELSVKAPMSMSVSAYLSLSVLVIDDNAFAD